MPQKPKKLESFLHRTGITLDGTYENNSQKLTWRCPEGCVFETTWRVLNKKQGCIICLNKRKLSYEEICEYLASVKTKLLVTKSEYKNSYDQDLDMICPNEHNIKKTFKAYKNHGCSICNPKSEKYDIAELKRIAAERGDTILSTEYVNAQTPLLFQCSNPDHDPYLSLWTTYNRDNVRTTGHVEKTQCRKCAYERLKISIAMLHRQILSEKYSILKIDKGENIPSRYDVKVHCDKNHESYVTTWNRWQMGKRCPYCSPMALKTLDEVKQILGTHGLTLIEENGYQYTGNKSPMKAVCGKGHITWKHLQAFERYGCSECTTAGTSSMELLLIQYFKQFNPKHRYKIKIPEELKMDNRTTSIELDIFFPEQKIAIEYCGLYWHGSRRVESLYWDDPDELSFQLNRNKYRHQYKKIICNSLGITLLTIFEDEFLTKRDIVLSRINHKLNVINKLYARNCTVLEIQKNESKDFFESYHLQENTHFEFGLKLEYNNEIIAAMTFGKPLPRNSVMPNDWELKRYCTTTKYQITGGAQRLFKHAVEEAKKREISAIFTYCDLRWGTGNVYKSLGFELIKEMTDPSPHVIQGAKRIRSRNIENENLIYDCGHQKWVFKIISP
jgi:hypothetical protein